MNVGLIAHDSKKKLMQNFCIAYRGILSKNSLYATGTTGRLIEEVTNLNVHKYLSGHLGGEQQMCTDIEQDQLDLVVFLREPVSPKQKTPDDFLLQIRMQAALFVCVMPIIFRLPQTWLRRSCWSKRWSGET